MLRDRSRSRSPAATPRVRSRSPSVTVWNQAKATCTKAKGKDKSKLFRRQMDNRDWGMIETLDRFTQQGSVLFDGMANRLGAPPDVEPPPSDTDEDYVQEENAYAEQGFLHPRKLLACLDRAMRDLCWLRVELTSQFELEHRR
jgi:hypothetical protein